MALHLRAQDQLRPQPGDRLLHREEIVGHDRFRPVGGGTLANVPGEFAGIGADGDDGETELVAGDAGGGQRVGGVAEDEDALAGQVGRIDGARIPGQARVLGGEQNGGVLAGLLAAERGDLGHEVAGGADADRHGLRRRLAEGSLQPLRRRAGDLGVEHDVEVGLAQARKVGRRRPLRRGDVDVDTEARQQAADLDDIVAMTEPQRRRSEDVARRAVARRRALRAGCERTGCGVRAGEGAHQLVEGFRRTPVLLLGIGGQLQRHHRHGKVEGGGEAAGIVLDQLGRAGGADQDRLGGEAGMGVAHRAFEQAGRVAAEVAGGEGRVGHGRALAPPLDHGEQKVCVGVPLRRVQHVVHAFHRGGDAHGTDVGRSLVGPDGQLHLRPPA